MVEAPEHSQVESTTWPLVGTTCPVGTEHTISTLSYGVFGTHWATRIFVPPSRQNRSIRHPSGKYQWASGRIFCTPSSPVHMTFTFMAKRTCQNRLFNIITHGQFIFLHCYFVCRKIDASSIIIRQLKTAPARAFIFGGNVVGFQRATYASQCKLRRSFNISHKK